MAKSLFLLFCLTPFLIFGQTGSKITETMEYDGVAREYILYVPQSYSGQTKVPLLLNLHGYTSDMDQQLFFGDFRKIADTANFIMVLPNGLPDNMGQRTWNCFSLDGVDDLGFLSQLIDKLSGEYAIDTDRVYSTGMSNGGLMSYFLACNLSEKITAIASVTGTMLKVPITDCSPEHPMPIMEIHGTLDAIVPYNGNELFESIPNVIDFWVNQTNCNPTPTVMNMPNINVLDGSTAERHLYSSGDNGATVEHFKIIGGGHTWPGSVIPLPQTNFDIDASIEIWRFFNQYKLSKLLSINEENQEESLFEVYPNPSNGSFHIIANQSLKEVRILTQEGKAVHILKDVSKTINVEGLSSGFYFVQTQTNGKSYTKKVIVL